MPSFYFPLEFEKGELMIDGDEFHHMVNVSRYHIQDQVLLNNGNGMLAQAIIQSISKKNAVLEIIDLKNVNKGNPEIAVAFSLLKNKNDLWIIEKLTELGIKHFFPMETRYSVRRIIDHKNKNADPLQEKMLKTAISAIKQCDNAFLPEIRKVDALEHTIRKIKDMDFLPILASEIEHDQSLISILDTHPQQNICFFIGPEGGFHPEEFELFNKHQVTPFSLGNHILRAETAAVSIASVITNHLYHQNPQYY